MKIIDKLNLEIINNRLDDDISGIRKYFLWGKKREILKKYPPKRKKTLSEIINEKQLEEDIAEHIRQEQDIDRYMRKKRYEQKRKYIKRKEQ